jgi:plasmid stabilization system protein ParE
MNVRLTPRALADAKRMTAWWRHHRPDAADLFEQELDAALHRIAEAPNIGQPYEQPDRAIAVRRYLMPRSRNHVYYAVRAAEIVVLTVWGAPRARGPRL